MKRNIKLSILVGICYLFSFAFVSAQNRPLLDSSSTLSSLIKNITGLFNLIIPLIISAAIIVFLYGVLRFIVKSSAGDADGRKEGVNFMIYGIIGIAVMVSVWGLVAFVTNTFGTTGVAPQFNETPWTGDPNSDE